MSYAGEYGPDETCPCDHYCKSCALHYLTGPNPKPGDVQRVRAQQERKQQEARERQAQLKNSYNALDDLEKGIALALWDLFIESYPGVKASLADAVSGNADSSWAVGRSRNICKEATVSAAAARRFLSVHR